VRHGETSCAGTERNGDEVTEEMTLKNRRKQPEPKRTAVGEPLSGPRCRPSNPCLPAKFDPRVGTSCKPKNHKYFIVATMLSPTGT
jgi:hypothetical protein